MNQTSTARDLASAPLERAGGAAGLAFGGGVVLQNGFLLAGAPLPSASYEAIQTFYCAAPGRVAVAVGWVAINVPLLLWFASAVSHRLERDARAAVAARMGQLGVVLVAAAFSTTTLLQAVLTARIDALVSSGQLPLVWHLHSAAFSTSGFALGATLIGFSLAALVDGTFLPRWTALLGLAGAVSLLVAGGLTVSTLSGGPGIFFQLAGFLAWLVWLVTASIRLLRG